VKTAYKIVVGIPQVNTLQQTGDADLRF